MSVAFNHEMICPKCGQDSDLYVAFVGECLLTPYGSDDLGYHVWTDFSACRCGCGWQGQVKNARREYECREGES